jgi:hypothetical protein
MATTFDTEPEAQSVAVKLNAAARREPHVRYHVERPRQVGDSPPERAHILGLGRSHYARVRW